MKDSPLISVILPVYNAEKYIAKSIECILNQSYVNFELIIINDGSKDNSEQVILSFSDNRIKYYKQTNQGLPKTLNVGLSYAKGDIIARQDQDDISLPTRFEKQLQFLKENPDVKLVGTWAKIIDDNGNSTKRFHHHATSSNELAFDIIFNNPFVHASVMFYKKEILELGGYSEDNSVFEDFNLWSRVSRKYKIANLSEELVLYRELLSSISRTTSNYNNRVFVQCIDNLNYYIPNQKELNYKLASVLHQNILKESINKNEILNIFYQLFDLLDKDGERLSSDFANIKLNELKLAMCRFEIYQTNPSFIKLIRLKLIRRLLLYKLNREK